MKKKRHKTEEIIRIIRKADSDQTVEEVCREENICVQTFYRWRRKYGRMEMAEAEPCDLWKIPGVDGEFKFEIVGDH